LKTHNDPVYLIWAAVKDFLDKRELWRVMDQALLLANTTYRKCLEHTRKRLPQIFGVRFDFYSKPHTTGLRRMPTPSSSTSTTSPGCIRFVLPGVPV
jgi:hypothetical protein